MNKGMKSQSVTKLPWSKTAAPTNVQNNSNNDWRLVMSLLVSVDRLDPLMINLQGKVFIKTHVCA